MNRRGFLQMLMAAAAAEALEPFTGKVFSFPSKIRIVPDIPDEVFQIDAILKAYYEDCTTADFLFRFDRTHPHAAKIASGIEAAKRRNEELFIQGVLNDGYRNRDCSQTS